jgi:signal transduction histidine kinase
VHLVPLPASPASDSPRDILVVDDNPANLMAIEAALGPWADRVVQAQSGPEALRLLLTRDFTLILLDVQMPGMGGIETARLIRSRERSTHTPIIFVTAYDQNDADVLAGYALDAVDFLAKPIQLEALRAKVKVLLELQHRADEIARQAAQLREHERVDHERRLHEERRRWDAEAMEQQMAALAETDRRKDEFLAMLGHELRNPLASVALGLELIGRRLHESLGADDSVHTTHGRVEQQVRHLARLVDDLLDLSRINSGKVELRRQSVALAEIIDGAVAASRPLMDERGHQLLVQGPASPVTLFADPVRLGQVLLNLLSNAAHFTPPGGTIRLRCRPLPDGVELSVSDNGRGIRPDLLPRVFEMFVQEEKPTGGGLGLGLTVVKHMVELHGGTVSVRSEGVGRGSEFLVRLPVEPPQPAPHPPAAHETPGRRLRIALVEDSPDIREMTTELLTMLGHEVEAAGDGEAGLALILRTRPDVALVDMGLPGLDGCEVAARVRAEIGRDGVRLVAMTGFGLDADRRRAREAGFDDYLVKPADVETLLRALAGPAD